MRYRQGVILTGHLTWEKRISALMALCALRTGSGECHEQTGRRYGDMGICGTRQSHDRDETRYPGGKMDERSQDASSSDMEQERRFMFMLYYVHSSCTYAIDLEFKH